MVFAGEGLGEFSQLKGNQNGQDGDDGGIKK